MRMRAVCFDFDGTLGYMHPTHWALYADAARDCGIAVSPAALAAERTDRVWAPWTTALGVAHPQASASEAAFRALRVALAIDRLRAAGAEGDERALRAAGERAADLEGDPARYRLYDDAAPALERLAAAGVPAFVISNHVWRLPEIVDALSLGAAFAGVVTSARCGYRKPHPEIFRAALRLTDATPEQIVMAGDSLAADVRGAEAVGMRAVLVDRVDRAGGADVPPGVTVIRSLLEVPLAWP